MQRCKWRYGVLNVSFGNGNYYCAGLGVDGVDITQFSGVHRRYYRSQVECTFCTGPYLGAACCGTGSVHCRWNSARQVICPHTCVSGVPPLYGR